MDNIIYCNCGSKVTKKKYKEHLKTKKHLNFTSKEDTNNDDVLEQTEKETEIEKVNDLTENHENKSDEEDKSDEEEIEEVLPKNTIAKKIGQSKEYMDAIRQKAIMTIKQKKQKKIDEENMVKQKALQYDVLVKSLKEKEENEKK